MGNQIQADVKSEVIYAVLVIAVWLGATLLMSLRTIHPKRVFPFSQSSIVVIPPSLRKRRMINQVLAKQIDTLVRLGYPVLLAMPEHEFTDSLAAWFERQAAYGVDRR